MSELTRFGTDTLAPAVGLVIFFGLGAAACGGGSGPLYDASAADSPQSADASAHDASAAPADGARSSDGGARDGRALDAGQPDGSAADGSAPDARSSDGRSSDGSSDAHASTDAAKGTDASRVEAGPDAPESTDASFTCGYCITPPLGNCTGSTTLQSYASSGSCSGATCTYASTNTTCAEGCTNGSCVPSAWVTMSSNTTQPLYAVWGSSASDVWAVGGNGVAVHFDGHSWTVAGPPGADLLFGVAGSGPQDVYATDGARQIYHFDGSWHDVSSLVPPGGNINLGLSAPAPGVLWIGGYEADALGYDKTALFEVTGSVGAGQIASARDAFISYTDSVAVLALSPTDIWVGSNPLTHSDGKSLTTLSASEAVSFWAASPASIFAGTGTASVNLWDGTTWTSSNTGTSLSTGGIWGTSPSRVFVALYGRVAEVGGNVGEVRSYNGLGWVNEAIPAGTSALYAVYAAPTGEVFAVGNDGTILERP